MKVVVTCEHGGNRIPAPYRHLFAGREALLDTHRAYDLGALGYARRLAARLEAPLFAATTSRLLADLNRNPGHPRIFSEFTRPLDPSVRRRILEHHHTPHWRRVRAAIEVHLSAGHPVLHVACHSFTPVLDGCVRDMDVGLLYDPRRPAERRLCDQLKGALAAAAPRFKVRRNAPYKGVSDGLATHLRRQLPQTYLGLELELNQRDYLENRARWRALCAAVSASLAVVAGCFQAV